MIPVLYRANATAFDTYGIGVLKDCTSCEVTEERNGAFECQFKYPISGPMYKQITTERLVKAKPNDTAADQVFRIYRISTPINGEVTVYAQHLSYDLLGVAALQWASDSISPSLAMERVFQNTATPHSFTCQTDYSSAKPFSVSKPQSKTSISFEYLSVISSPASESCFLNDFVPKAYIFLFLYPFLSK